ncbi:DUF3995 domain-containing protein [Paenibacillus sp.]|uniref:DUF3995 domain-containing protein n=1 Tax=Paenibacillus sp. TaxID=58172 RepID=UPI0028123464|nr:DUF3995 domain-containing protein [Paenibacillus sp.]
MRRCRARFHGPRELELVDDGAAEPGSAAGALRVPSAPRHRRIRPRAAHSGAPPPSVATGAVAAAFLQRAIGEFKRVGFTKRRTGTVFAKWDSALYSPLCLFLGIGVAIVTLA